MKKVLLFVAFASFLFAKMTVAVSIEPQRFLVEQIAGEKASVVVMVPAGSSAHSYEPKPKEMRELANADIYLAIGIEFEKAWLGKFASTNKKMLIIESDRLIKKLEMKSHKHHDHNHGRFDTHIWLSANNMIAMARSLAVALATADQQNSGFYMRNYSELASKIATLDSEIATDLAKYRGKSFMVFHPAWGYFANDYGLDQIAIETEGKEPKPKELATLINKAKAENIKMIFVQPRESPKTAEVIAKEIGAVVVKLDPLDPNWFRMMQNCSEAIKNAMERE